MKILLTGASGYIGSTILQQLAKKQIEVVALCHNKTSLPLFPGVQKVYGDITDENTIDNALWNCDYVIHNAAFAKMSCIDTSLFYEINIKGTQVILDKCKQAQVKKVVHVSTAGVTGSSNSIVVDEKMPRMTPFTNHYDCSKAITESMVFQYAIDGLPACITRLPRVYGPGTTSLSSFLTKLIKKFINGKWHFIPGDGSAIGSYTFSEDVAKGIISAITNGKPGSVYNLGGINATYNTFFDTLKFVSGKNNKLINVPAFILYNSAALNEMFNKAAGIPSGFTKPIVHKLISDNPINSNKAIKELNYKITSLEEGLFKTIKWLNHEKF
jgi:nucleoside-diphosphate-sugar epimerase